MPRGAIPAGRAATAGAMRQDVRVSTDASAIVAEPAQPAEPAEPAEPQAVVAPLTKAAIFLVAVVNPDAASADAAVSLCADVPRWSERSASAT